MHRRGEPTPSLCGGASGRSHSQAQHAGGQEHGSDRQHSAATQQPLHNCGRLRPSLRRDRAPEHRGCRGIILLASHHQGKRPGRQSSQMSSTLGHLLAEKSAQLGSWEITS